MRHVAFFAAVFGVASILAAANSHKAHAAPLNHTQNTNISTVHMASAQKPKPTPRIVTVKSGDNLSKLAEIYASTAARIFYANTQIKNPNLIYPNEKLHIPTAGERLAPRHMPGHTSPVVASSRTISGHDGDGDSDDATVATPAAAPAPPVRKSAPRATVSSTGTSVWDRLANCESSGNWSINTGNGFYGGLQFTLSSWRAVGGTGYPNHANKAEQIARAKKLQAIQGWGAWPACSIKLGLR